MNKYVKCTTIPRIKDKCFIIENDGINIKTNSGSLIFVKSQFIEISKTEYIQYLKSINLKERLIELGAKKEYYFTINNLENAIKLDNLFTLLDAKSYKNRNSKDIIENFFRRNRQNFKISFNSTENIKHKIASEHIELTFDSILNYV